MFLSRVWKAEAAGCCSLFSKLCRIPYPKYMINPRRKMRRWKGKVGAAPSYTCPKGLLLWRPRQFRGDAVEEYWVQSLKQSLYPRKLLTNHIPDSKLGPSPRGHLYHQVNVHTDAHQWEDRQSRDLWAESVHPWTQPRRLKGRPDPRWARRPVLRLCVQWLLRLYM